MPLTDVVALDAIIPALKVNGKKQALQEIAACEGKIFGM
jgi:PTS system nitrogen regulatory IIA component